MVTTGNKPASRPPAPTCCSILTARSEPRSTAGEAVRGGRGFESPQLFDLDRATSRTHGVANYDLKNSIPS